MRWLLGLGLAITLTFALAQGARADDGLEPYRNQELTWRACGQGTWCTLVQVPLEYANPGGRRITLAARALSPRPPDGSRQALLVNPGGPGSAAVDFVPYFSGLLARQVRDTYDVIGIDPRGVGESTPVTCMTGRGTTRWLRTDPSPDTDPEVTTLMRRAAQIAPGCLRMSGDLARNIGSEVTVADMDLVRSVLDQATLNWFGYSYGTYLGTRYAERFPNRVGRMVLDGAVDPALNSMQVSRDQSRGFQTALRRFAADCARRSGCPLGSSTKDVLAGINGLLASLDRSPLPTESGGTLVQADAITALFFGMYSTDLWPLLEDALAAAYRGGGTDLASIADIANDRTGPNTYGSNINSAFVAIGCWDYPAPPGRVGLAAAAQRWSAGAAVPDLARAIAWGNAPCSTWFGHSPIGPAPAASSTAAEILIVGTVYDPATPYEWSRRLHARLPTSRLLTYVGDGHTAYGSGSACVDSAVDTYLLTGALPAEGTRC